MRLVNVETGRLEDFHSDTPSYAILSHTWGKDHEEISFQDMQGEGSVHRRFDNKLNGLCRQAKSDGHSYVWIDTCCIDKSNSVELGEAINSMFRWYEESAICYVHLTDVSARDGKVDPEQFHRSRWFTRGWTLQELLAPKNLRFYDNEWCLLGEKYEMASAIENITGIPYGILLGFDDLSNASVAQRMSWAARRITKRKEDIAYCLLGIFDVMLPMIYGEKERAFIRLQEEIIKKTADDSILAWGMCLNLDDSVQTQSTDINLFGNALATSPADFMHSGNIVTLGIGDSTLEGLEAARGCLPLRLRLCDIKAGQTFGFLNCGFKNNDNAVVGIPLLYITPGSAPREYIRPKGSKAILCVPPLEGDPTPRPIRIRASLPSNKAVLNHRKYGFHFKQWPDLQNIDLGIIDTYLEGKWDKDRAVLGTVVDIRFNTLRRAWFKIRQQGRNFKDFVFALELRIQQMEVRASCHLMVASRDTDLEIIGRAAASSDGFLGSRVACNDSLTLEIKLSQDFLSSKLFIVTLEVLAEASQPMNTMVDADQELKIFAHAKSILELYANSWLVSLKLSEYRTPLENKKQAQDPLFLDLLGEKEAIRSQISLEYQSVQDLMAHSESRRRKWHHSMLISLCKHLQLKDHPSTDGIPNMVRRAFIRAIVKGHIVAMEYLVSNFEVDRAVEDSKGRGALALAVAVDNIPMLESLISKGFAVDHSDSRGQSPLAKAALLGHTAALSILFEKGASTDFQIGDGRTPLDVAVRANQSTIVRALLQKGADVRGGLQYQYPSLRPARHQPPLALAARMGFTDIIGCLLDYGADVNETGYFDNPTKQNEVGFLNCPALALAAYMGHYDVVNLLLSRSADIDATDKNGQTSLSLAARNGHDDIVKLLLQRGAVTEMPDSQGGGTPLAFAAAYGHYEVVALLLDHGADIDAKDRQLETAIIHSIRANSCSTLQLLLSRNADINSAQDGEPPIFFAIRQVNLEAVDLLIRYGSRISTESTFDRLPLRFAQNLYAHYTTPNQLLRMRQKEVIQKLEAATIEHNQSVNQLLKMKQKEIIQKLEVATIEHNQYVAMETKPTVKSKAQRWMGKLMRSRAT